jgi:hypothetical protein
MDSNVTEMAIDEYQQALAALKKNFLECMEILNILENTWIAYNRETKETK